MSRFLSEISPASSALRQPQGPSRTERSARIRRFALARMSMIACSATGSEFTSPATQRGIRRGLRAARALRDAAFRRSTDAASIGSLFGLRTDLARQLPELRHAGPCRSGEKPRVSRHRRHVEAPRDGARRVIRRSAMERGADPIGLARSDNLLERRDHLGLLAIEARGKAALREAKREIRRSDIQSV